MRQILRVFGDAILSKVVPGGTAEAVCSGTVYQYRCSSSLCNMSGERAYQRRSCPRTGDCACTTWVKIGCC